MKRFEELATLYAYGIGCVLVVVGAVLAYGWKVGLIAAGTVILCGSRS